MLWDQLAVCITVMNEVVVCPIIFNTQFILFNLPSLF